MVYFLDAALDLIGIADQIYLLSWHRSFVGAGTVKAVMPSRFLPAAKQARYLYRAQTGDVALIEGVDLTGEGNLTVLGKEAKAVLQERILPMPLTPKVSTPARLFNTLLTHALVGGRAIPHLQAEPLPPEYELQLVDLGDGGCGRDLLDFFLSCLNPLGMGIEVVDRQEHLLLRWTVGRDVSGRVCFSQRMDNLSGVEYSENRAQGYNVVYIKALDAQGEEYLTEVNCCPQGDWRREGLIDARALKRSGKDPQGNAWEWSEEEFQGILIGLGENACKGPSVSYRITVDPAADFCYREDFDVGDLVSVCDGETGAVGVCRVLGALEEESAHGKVLRVELSDIS